MYMFLYMHMMALFLILLYWPTVRIVNIFVPMIFYYHVLVVVLFCFVVISVFFLSYLCTIGQHYHCHSSCPSLCPILCIHYCWLSPVFCSAVVHHVFRLHYLCILTIIFCIRKYYWLYYHNYWGISYPNKLIIFISVIAPIDNCYHSMNFSHVYSFQNYSHVHVHVYDHINKT